MIFNPLFFSLINSNSSTRLTTRNINDISNSFPMGEVSNGFFEKIPKYLFSDIMNVLLVKDEKTNPAMENSNRADKNIFSTQSVQTNSDVNSDLSIDSRVQQNKNDVKINPLYNGEKISNKLDLVYSFINDFSLQNVFGSKVEEIKSKLKESILNNNSAEITIDKNVLESFVNKLISNLNQRSSDSIESNGLYELMSLRLKSNEVKVVLNNDESVDNANAIESKSSKNSVNEENKISNEEKISTNSTSKQEPNLLDQINSNPFEKNFLPLNLIDLLDGGKIIIENNTLSNETKLVIEIESSEENNFNSANQFKLKMNIVPVKNNEINAMNNDDELINYSDYGNSKILQSNSVKHSSGIWESYEGVPFEDIPSGNVFPLNEDDNIDYSKIELVNNDEIVSANNLISSDEQFDIQNRLMLENPAKINDYKIEINPKNASTTAIDELPVNDEVSLKSGQTNQKSSSDFWKSSKEVHLWDIPSGKVKIVLNNSSEKINSFIQLDKNDLLNKFEEINLEKVNESETMIMPDENEISNQKINKNELENIEYAKGVENSTVRRIKISPNEIIDNKIYSASKYIKNFKSIDDLDVKNKKTEKLNFENENIIHQSEEKKIPLVRPGSLQVKINSSDSSTRLTTRIKNDDDLIFINKNLKHQQNINNKLESEKIVIHKNEFENVKKENNNSESNKINIKAYSIDKEDSKNYYQDEKNEASNKDNNSTNNFGQKIKNENNENKKIDFDLKENVSSEPHSEKIINQTKKDFISNINGKEILNSEINNLPKGEVNTKYFSSEKIIEISELFKEVISLISKKENGIIKLQIKPESLGKISITIDSVKEIVNAKIEVENKSVQALLENNINQLYSNLNQNGVQLSSVQIFLNQGESKNYRPNYSKKKMYEENNNGLNEEEEKITSRKLGYNTYEYLI